MQPNQVQNPQSQEIDLGNVYQSIGRFFGNVLTNIFKFILFLKSKILIVLILGILGVLLGFFIDGPKKEHQHEIIVKPNFESVDYLYAKIELLNRKITTRNFAYLDSLGFKNSCDLKSIKVEPLTDVYLLVNNSKDNFDLLKLLAEDGDIKNVIEDKTTSKYYPNHHILIRTKGETSARATFDPLMKFLNQSAYYTELQKVVITNLERKIASNDSTIQQIDRLLATISSNESKDRAVYVSENTQVADILEQKNLLEQDIAFRRIKLLDAQKIIKELEIISNVRADISIFTRMKVVLPLVFIAAYCLGFSFVRLYKQQTQKINARH